MMHVYVKIEINEREEKRPSTNEKTCPSSAFVGGNLSYCYQAVKLNGKREAAHQCCGQEQVGQGAEVLGKVESRNMNMGTSERL